MEIAKKPFLMSMAGNPMRYLLTNTTSGGGGAVDGGIQSVVEIGFFSVDSTPGHSIDVTFLGETHTFTLHREPRDNDQLPVADKEWDQVHWCQACFEYVLNNIPLLEQYEITLRDDGAAIWLTAKTASPDFDWTVGENNIEGLNIAMLAPGVLPPATTVDGVLMSVMKNGTQLLGQDYKPLAADGTVKFEIQEYVYASLLQAPHPRFHLSIPVYYYHIYYDYFLKYRTVFCDKIAGVFSPRTYTDPVNMWTYAIGGGLNREDLVVHNQTLTDFFNQAETKKRFMTWSPSSQQTDKDETHSLFFAFQVTTYKTYRMKANLYNSTGDDMTTIDVTNTMGVGQWTVVEFLAGYYQIGLFDYLFGDVARWEVFLVNEEDQEISDIREFFLDTTYAENTRYFRFRNSWGTYDSMRCTGVFENISQYDREKVVYISDELETSFNAPGSYTVVKETESFKANTGWLTRAYLNYLRDFMLSTDIYEVKDGKLLKCLVTSSKATLFRDAQYNYSLAFEYERAYDDCFIQIPD